MRLFPFLKKKSSLKKGNRSIKNQCYLTLNELPQFNWLEINKNNFNYLFKEEREFTKSEALELNDVYRTLLSEYITLYGFSENFKEGKELEKEIAELNCDLIITGDTFIQNDIRRCEFELNALKEDKNDTDFGKVEAYMNINMPYLLDLKKISVIAFNNVLNLINEKNSKK